MTRHAAGILLVARNSRRALFLRRPDGAWETPAGFAEPGDAEPFATAMRELREETGYAGDLIIARPKLRVSWLPDGEMLFGHVWPLARERYTGFVGYAQREFQPTLDHEHVSSTWKKIPEAPRPLAPGVDWTLSWARAMKLA